MIELVGWMLGSFLGGFILGRWFESYRRSRRRRRIKMIRPGPKPQAPADQSREA